MARQHIIVGRDDLGLYHTLSADWAGEQDFAVVLDRRVRERRHDSATATIERRHADRRQRPPVEAFLTWRGGGASTRRSDVRDTLNDGPVSIALRQRPPAKAESRTAVRRQPGPSREQAVAHQPTSAAPTNVAVALVALLGSLSGGIFGGLALWLLLTYEFSRRQPAVPTKQGPLVQATHR